MNAKFRSYLLEAAIVTFQTVLKNNIVMHARKRIYQYLKNLKIDENEEKKKKKRWLWRQGYKNMKPKRRKRKKKNKKLIVNEPIFKEKKTKGYIKSPLKSIYKRLIELSKIFPLSIHVKKTNEFRTTVLSSSCNKRAKVSKSPHQCI